MKLITVDTCDSDDFTKVKCDDAYTWNYRKLQTLISYDSIEEANNTLKKLNSIYKSSNQVTNEDSIYFYNSSFPSLLLSRMSSLCPFKRTKIENATKIVMDKESLPNNPYFLIGCEKNGVFYKHLNFYTDDLIESTINNILDRLKVNNPDKNWGLYSMTNSEKIFDLYNNNKSIVFTYAFVKEFLSYLPSPTEDELKQIIRMLDSNDRTNISMGINMCQSYDIRDNFVKLIPYLASIDGFSDQAYKYLKYLYGDGTHFYNSTTTIVKILNRDFMNQKQLDVIINDLKDELIKKIQTSYNFELNFLNCTISLNDKNGETTGSSKEVEGS